MIVNKISRRSYPRNYKKYMFSNVSANQTGFTLIEIIVSIVVMTIIAVIAGVGMVEISRGYVFTQKNAGITQRGHIAMTRLKKEFSNMNSVCAATPTSIAFRRSSDPPPPSPCTHTISWAGGSSPLLVDGDTLIGPVASFNLAYYDSYNSSASSYSASTSILEIVFELVGAENSPLNFTDRVNLYLETGG